MIELLIGNIASGKSTYATQRAEEGWLVVSDDAIIAMLLADRYSLYSRMNHESVVKGCVFSLVNCLVDAHLDVVVDSAWLVMYSFREHFFVRYADTKIRPIEFLREAPEVHARRRMEHDSRGGTYEMWLEVARRIDSWY